jgi:hypothetical protein
LAELASQASTPDSTEAERRLLSFMGEAFGRHLSLLLLFGLREVVKVRSRRLVIGLAGNGRNKKQYLRIGATHNSFLPSGQDPLVLSALIKLLFLDAGGNGRSVLYAYEDLLPLLGWSDSVETRRAVDRAVVRYFNLYYQPVRTLSELTGKTSPLFIHRERLISTYGSVDGTELGGPSRECGFNLVTFNPHIIEQLKRKSLFSIDWTCVGSLTYLPLKARK